MSFSHRKMCVNIFRFFRAPCDWPREDALPPSPAYSTRAFMPRPWGEDLFAEKWGRGTRVFQLNEAVGYEPQFTPWGFGLSENALVTPSPFQLFWIVATLGRRNLPLKHPLPISRRQHMQETVAI